MLKILNRMDRIKSYNSDDSEPEPGSQADCSDDSKLSSEADTLCEPKIRCEGGFMFNLVKDVFGKFFGVLLWINLALWAFIGFAKFYDVYDSVECGIAGLISGAIIGMLINIVWGGFFATIISIERSVKSRKAGE